MIAASVPEREAAAQAWLKNAFAGNPTRREAADLLLQAWWLLTENKPFDDTMPAEADRQAGWRAATQNRVVEIGWLDRAHGARAARYEPLTLAQVGL